MKTKLLLTTIVSAFFILPSAFGQGPLTPPGAPAPTMKTLAQIEPRTAITNTASAVTITNSGSYYLTGNLTVSSGDAITIAANGVTLDLKGFTVRSALASPAGSGILLTNALRDITILNGHILGGLTNNGFGVYGGNGFANGIAISSNAPANVLVANVTVSGCPIYGIQLAVLAEGLVNATVVEACTVRTVGSVGILASTIKGCEVTDCGGFAIYGDHVSDCRGAGGNGAYGVYAVTAQNCTGSSSGNGHGIDATTALNCTGNNSGNGLGISATTALNCYGNNFSVGTGLFADTAQNCYGYSITSGTGINATTAQNCHGVSGGSGTGIFTDLAQGCYGQSTSGTGLNAFIANSCHGISTSGTPLSVTHNVNSF